MIFNIIVGFFLPWCFGIYLVKKSPKTIIQIYPIVAFVSMVINNFGYKYEFWVFKPVVPSNESFSALPFDLGLYPILGSFMIWMINKHRKKTLLLLLIYVTGTTALEFIILIIGKVSYGNGWNIGYTFLSYLLAFTCVYLYFRLLIKFDLYKST